MDQGIRVLEEMGEYQELDRFGQIFEAEREPTGSVLEEESPFPWLQDEALQLLGRIPERLAQGLDLAYGRTVENERGV